MKLIKDKKMPKTFVFAAAFLLSASLLSSQGKITLEDKAAGWASYTGQKDLAGGEITPPDSVRGTTGGYGGTVYRVKTSEELKKAIHSAGAKIIVVEGMIDMTDTGSGSMLPSAVTGSTPALDKFIETHTQKSVLPCRTYREWKEKFTASFDYNENQNGPAGDLREELNHLWRSQTELIVGDDTTVIGAAVGCGIRGGCWAVRGVRNVIIRNLEISDCYNPFPAFEAGDGLNASLDGVTVRNSKYVWIDHCTLKTSFSPEEVAKDKYKTKDGISVKWQVYDGLCDIVQTNDFVTVSWCIFKNHDKTMLIGNGDKVTADINHQTVTLHHNIFDSCVQRLPMVRFATIHIYNNVYVNQKRYGIDCRKDSRIYSEKNNFEETSKSCTDNKQGSFYDTGSLNLKKDKLDSSPVWKPSDYYSYTADSPENAKKEVLSKAGAGKIPVQKF
ncbi:MAG: right-handed parallel beta-helix repeat-containing protein [Treponema sp.]|nr:right-handed parallel beta-helix repeat-containing protein [Treponema sp.]